STIDPLVEIITYKLPILGISVGHLLDNPVFSSALVGNFDAFFEALDIFKDMSFPTPGGTIDLGSFSITQDARLKNHGPNSDDFVDLAAAQITTPAVDP